MRDESHVVCIAETRGTDVECRCVRKESEEREGRNLYNENCWVAFMGLTGLNVESGLGELKPTFAMSVIHVGRSTYSVDVFVYLGYLARAELRSDSVVFGFD
jgi:hypothetical protein